MIVVEEHHPLEITYYAVRNTIACKFPFEVHHHLGWVAVDYRSLPIATLLILLHAALYGLPVETQLLYKHTVDTYAEIQGYQGNFTHFTHARSTKCWISLCGLGVRLCGLTDKMKLIG